MMLIKETIPNSIIIFELVKTKVPKPNAVIALRWIESKITENIEKIKQSYDKFRISRYLNKEFLLFEGYWCLLDIFQ